MNELETKDNSIRKIIYGVAAFLTPMAGTACGMFGALLAGAYSLVSIDEYANYGFKTPEHFAQGMSEWVVEFAGPNARNDFMSNYISLVVLFAILFAAGLTALCILSGSFNKDEDGSIRLNGFDRMWTELQLFLGVCSASFAVMSAIPVVEMFPNMPDFAFFKPSFPDNYVFQINNSIVLALCAVGMCLFIEIAVLLFVSLVKKLKAGRFLDTALLGKSIRLIKRGASSVSRQFSVPHDDDEKANRKLTFYYMAVLIGMILLAALIPGLGAIIDIIILAVFVPTKTRQLLEVQKGVVEVKSGNLKYRIPVREDAHGPKTELDKLAADINTISVATNAAVQNELKSQRMKVELISNVSHDLRTPLTSMISYVDILKKEGLDSEKAPEYLDIIEDKTKRLKDLTDNLFEAAKASSGNIPCDIIDIDLAALLEQEIGEFDDLFAAAGLNVISSVKADNTMVKADGRLLARVLENVLGNVSKYALEGSRVYAEIKEVINGRLLLEVKNISREQLNITPEELMERFARGDESRNTEGSGLGLAIAKDLTQLMGGAFEISIDGDMFKASILLDRA